jgi:hypothetical protein
VVVGEMLQDTAMLLLLSPELNKRMISFTVFIFNLLFRFIKTPP